MNQTLDLINARTSTRTFSADPDHRRRARSRPERGTARADRRRHDAVLDRPDRRPGDQGPPRRDLRRPAVHRPCAVGPGVRRRHAAVDGPVRGVGRAVAAGRRAPRRARTRRPHDGVLRRSHRGAERSGGRRVARHRVVLHRRRPRAGRDPRRAARSAAPHAAGGDAVPRPAPQPTRRPHRIACRTWCTPTAITG